MRLERLRPDLADTPLKGAQLRALIASGKPALEFLKNVSEARASGLLAPR
jgi:hypothetical protein